MTEALELLDRDRILADLTNAARAALNRLEVYSALDSTNNYLLARAGDGWPSGVVCLAEQQTSGRGRQGRNWLTPFGASLAFSLLWRFSVPPPALSGLSLAAGIAVVRVLRDLGADGVGLKWPNDVLCQGRKLGGILLESGGVADAFHVVAGIGLNVALPRLATTVIDQPWIDLLEILEEAPISRNRLAARLVSELIGIFIRFQEGGFADLISEWARFDQVVGRQVRLQLPNAVVAGIARGVDATGALLLETPDGRITPYLGGEISLRVEA